MSEFTLHNETTAPSEAAPVLAAAKQRYGFVPNLAGYVAESPQVLAAILDLSEKFEQTTLTTQEQQLVLLTASTVNDCDYCAVAHTALGKNAGVSAEILRAVKSSTTVQDEQLEALRRFTRLVVTEKGWVSQQAIQAFLEAGFSKAQVFEVIMGVALKTLTNYSNHIAGAEPNPEFLALTADIIES